MKSTVLDMNATNGDIDRACQVRNRVEAAHGLEVKDWYVRKVLREHMGQRYKKIKKIPFHGNSDKNLILRQQFSKKMLNLMGNHRRILNVDETWLSTTCFKRSKWRAHGSSNSAPEKFVTPRISVIAGVDTEGDIYVALTQVNTNTEVMRLFLT